LRCCKTSITLTAKSTILSYKSRVFIEHISNDVATLFVLDDSTPWHFDIQVLSALAFTSFCTAIFAVFGSKMLGKLEVHQCTSVVVDGENNATTIAAVASVRSTFRNIFFGVERYNTVTAVACLDEYSCDIKKHILYS